MIRLVGWARSLILAVVIGFPACADRGGETPAAPSTPSPTPRPPSIGACFGTLDEIGGPKPMPTDPSRGGTACANLISLEERHCPGHYVAIAEVGIFAGSTSYYDGARLLFAARLRSDTTQYCNGTSFDRIYGTLPVCPVAELVTPLCRR